MKPEDIKEPTVEEALAELGQMFKHVSLKVTLCRAPGCRAYRYQVSPQLTGPGTDPTFHSDSLRRCMGEVRKWKREQP